MLVVVTLVVVAVVVDNGTASTIANEVSVSKPLSIRFSLKAPSTTSSASQWLHFVVAK